MDLYQDKSCYIIIGSKKVTEEISEELKLCPLTLYGKSLKEKNSEKYLGDFIHSGGLSESADATVKERIGKMCATHRDIKSIV